MLAYLAAWGGCTFVSAAKNLPNFFRFEIEMFVKQIAAIAIVLLFSISWNIMSIRDGKLVQQTAAVPVKMLGALGKLAAKSKAPEKDFIRRYNKIHASSYRLSIGMSLLIGGMLVLCANKINYQMFVEFDGYKSVADFQLEKINTKYKDVADGPYIVEGREHYNYAVVYDSTVGLKDTDIEILENTWGVDSVYSTLLDRRLYMEWEGMENSLLLKDEFIRDWQIRFWIPESKDEIMESMKRDGLYGQVDWDAWDRGEQVIVYMVNKLWNEETSAYENYMDNTLHTGDIVEIKSMDGETQAIATVAVVGYTDNHSFCDNYNLLRTGYCLYEVGVFVSRDFAQKFAGEEGGLVKTNHIVGYYNTVASYEATDKLVAEFAAERKFEYYTNAEWRVMRYREIVQRVAIYGALFAMILVVFMVLQKNFMEIRNRYRSEQYLLFKKIGMTEKHYMKVAVKGAMKEYAWIFGGILVGNVIDGLIFAQKELGGESAEYGYYSELMDKIVYTHFETALDYLVTNINHSVTLVVMVLVFALLLVDFYMQTRKYLKQNNY